MATYFVSLPKSQAVHCPDICVACKNPSPSEKSLVKARPAGLWRLVRWMPGPRQSLEVPVCRACHPRLTRSWWLREVGFWVYVAIAIVAVIWLMVWYHGPMGGGILMGTALLLVVPFLVWDYVFPGLVNFTVGQQNTTYEFKDQFYAIRFRFINDPIFGGGPDAEGSITHGPAA